MPPVILNSYIFIKLVSKDPPHQSIAMLQQIITTPNVKNYLFSLSQFIYIYIYMSCRHFKKITHEDFVFCFLFVFSHGQTRCGLLIENSLKAAERMDWCFSRIDTLNPLWLLWKMLVLLYSGVQVLLCSRNFFRKIHIYIYIYI